MASVAIVDPPGNESAVTALGADNSSAPQPGDHAAADPSAQHPIQALTQATHTEPPALVKLSAAADVADLDRPYQNLPDSVLAAQSADAQRHRDAARLAAATAQADALNVFQAHAQARGPASTALTAQTAAHEEVLADLAAFRAQVSQIRAVQAQHREVAGELRDAETELAAALGAFSGRRKAQLSQRITQIRAEQPERLHRLGTTARTADELQNGLGSADQQRQQGERAHNPLRQRPALADRADRQDRELVTERTANAIVLTAAAGEAADRAGHLAAEQTYRGQHPDAAAPGNHLTPGSDPAAAQQTTPTSARPTTPTTRRWTGPTVRKSTTSQTPLTWASSGKRVTNSGRELSTAGPLQRVWLAVPFGVVGCVATTGAAGFCWCGRSYLIGDLGRAPRCRGRRRTAGSRRPGWSGEYAWDWSAWCVVFIGDR